MALPGVVVRPAKALARDWLRRRAGAFAGPVPCFPSAGAVRYPARTRRIRAAGAVTGMGLRNSFLAVSISLYPARRGDYIAASLAAVVVGAGLQGAVAPVWRAGPGQANQVIGRSGFPASACRPGFLDVRRGCDGLMKKPVDRGLGGAYMTAPPLGRGSSGPRVWRLVVPKRGGSSLVGRGCRPSGEGCRGAMAGGE